MKWYLVTRTQGSGVNKPYANLIRAIDAYDKAIASGDFIYVAIMEVGNDKPFVEWTA